MNKETVFNKDKQEIEKQYYFSFFWGVLFAAVFHIAMIYFAYIYSSEIQKVSEKQEKILIEEFFKKKANSSYSVILFGDSKLRYGLDLDNEHATDNIASIWYGVDGASYSKLEKYLDIALSASPDFIVIDSHILSNNSVSLKKAFGQRRNFIVKASSGVFKYIYHGILYKMTAEDNWRLTRAGVDSSCLTYFSKQELNYKIGFNEDIYNHDLYGPETEKFREYIKLAINKGIQVVIIDIPSHESQIKLYGIEPHRVNYPKLGFKPTRQQLLPQSLDEVIWLRLNRELETKYFCDFTHLNLEGRKLFTNWFLSQLYLLK